MRGSRNFTEAAAAVEFVPESFAQPLSLHAVFADEHAPLEVDLGCGDGSFLAAVAGQNPARNFLGVEQMLGRVRASCRRIDRLQLPNARIIRGEMAATVRVLPAGSVEVFHLLFPDPWPKRRHHRRRVFTRELLHALNVALKPRGMLSIATDQRDYFAEMLEVVGTTQLFSQTPSPAPHDLPRSTFEERFLEAGEEIYRLVLRKDSG